MCRWKVVIGCRLLQRLIARGGVISNLFTPQRNHLLAVLPEADQQRIYPLLDLVHLELDVVLHDGRDEPQYAYFPVDGMVSMVYLMEGGSSTEVAVVGREGMIGISSLMGSATNPNQALVTGAGHAYRMNTYILRREFDKSSVMQEILLRYTQAVLIQLAQTAVCNRHHTVEQQICRWLLMSLDRLPSDTVPVTQETIAQILGVRREGVKDASVRLEAAGIIGGMRGTISVLDRDGLEKACCECYALVCREFQRLFPCTPEPSHP
jgi:CRP-like cAMP-binding protein